MMDIMDKNGDDLVDLLEFAAGADRYLELKSIVAGGPRNPNITCQACASGWKGQHCTEEMTPVEIKIAVRASQAYFSAQKQEALRRALAGGLQWNQVRVVVKSVVTTETEGQLMHAELLAGGRGRARGSQDRGGVLGEQRLELLPIDALGEPLVPARCVPDELHGAGRGRSAHLAHRR